MEKLEITREDMALAKSFMAGRHIPAAVNQSTARPIKNRESLSPNMTSFVQSPEGNAMLKKLLTNPHKKPIKGQLVNSVGIV